MDPFIGEDGVERGLGLLMPPPGFVTAFPAFEDVHPILSEAEIERIAKSGQADKRSVFDLSWILNQQSKGSCNGFAGAGALMRARFRRGLGKLLLSGAYIYSRINGGRDQGSMLEDGMKEMQQYGIATQATVPWDKIYPGLYPSSANAEAARFKGFECYAVRSKIALYSALALDFDCVVAVDVADGFEKFDSRGVAGGSNGPGNHAVHADGLRYAGGTVVANGVNSWGQWGDDGRMGLTWDDNFASTSPNHVFYAVRSATDDPQGEQPPELRNAA